MNQIDEELEQIDSIEDVENYSDNIQDNIIAPIHDDELIEDEFVKGVEIIIKKIEKNRKQEKEMKRKSFKERYQGDDEFRKKHLIYMMEKVTCQFCPNTEFGRNNVTRHNASQRHKKNVANPPLKTVLPLVNEEKELKDKILNEFKIIDLKFNLMELQDKKNTAEYRVISEKRTKFQKLINGFKLK